MVFGQDFERFVSNLPKISLNLSKGKKKICAKVQLNNGLYILMDNEGFHTNLYSNSLSAQIEQILISLIWVYKVCS